ncbi:hypothetical protein EST38_g6276 [Candolleomyces aberdarensis]|uniref:Uncharacterized protein n=1 Tax=Candolleomyces aberdarensis TaxID=2316362 RepID=A0A4Q2DK57_9AGAR|nr:hypothetical protein EST38_g6276 [Candolleomyces aberdarensis]
MTSVSTALLLLLRTWQHSATPSRLAPPTIALGDEESDSDATCVGTENESTDPKAGIAGNARRPLNFLVPPRKYPRAPKHLPGIPVSNSVQISVAEPHQNIQLPRLNLGAGVREDEDKGHNWQEQVRKLNAQLSKDKAESGRLIFVLRQQLEVAEKGLRREQDEVWSLRAEAGMKDLYIRSLYEARQEGQVVFSAMQERIARAEATIAQLAERLAEKEVEGSLKDLHIRLFTRRIEESESSCVSMEAALEQKDVELTQLRDALAEQETVERTSSERQETLSSLKDIVAEKDVDIAQLSARLAQEESEGCRKDRQILSLSETSQQLEGLCSSLKKTITKNDTTIEDLKRRLSEKATEVRMKESRIQALSDARRYPPESSKAEMQKVISQYEHRITELNDRLAECHKHLLLASAGSGPGRPPNPYYWIMRHPGYSREAESGTNPSYTRYESA